MFVFYLWPTHYIVFTFFVELFAVPKSCETAQWVQRLLQYLEEPNGLSGQRTVKSTSISRSCYVSLLVFLSERIIYINSCIHVYNVIHRYLPITIIHLADDHDMHDLEVL